jgi:hypothetical protein
LVGLGVGTAEGEAVGLEVGVWREYRGSAEPHERGAGVEALPRWDWPSACRSG